MRRVDENPWAGPRYQAPMREIVNPFRDFPEACSRSGTPSARVTPLISRHATPVRYRGFTGFLRLLLLNVFIIIVMAGAIFTTLQLFSSPPRRYCTERARRNGCIQCPDNAQCHGRGFHCRDGFTKVLRHCIPVSETRETNMTELVREVRDFLRAHSNDARDMSLLIEHFRKKSFFKPDDGSIKRIKLAVDLTDEFVVHGEYILKVDDRKNRSRDEFFTVSLAVVLWAVLAVLIYRRTLL